MFRGKESSNRIKISRLVQELLNFGVFCCLWLWGGGRWVGDVWGIWGMGVSPYTHTCTHIHVNTCIEIANGHWHGGIHVYHVYHYLACMCMHACACMCAWDTLLHTHTHSHSHPPICHPPRGDPGIGQNSITLELIKIFQFCLKIWNLWRILHTWVGAWFGGQVDGWVGWWVGSGQITKI